MTLNDIQRRIKRSKQSERDLGHWLQKHDGVDPRWVGIASSALRVGHITGLQFDCVSMTYVAENKQVKLPATLLKWWIQINQIAVAQGKEALLRIEPTNDVKSYGVPKKVASLHILTEDRHAELLRKEREYDSVAEDAWKYRDISES